MGSLTRNAKVYIGNNLCGTLPANIDARKIYKIKCDLVGDFVKITRDYYLSLSTVEVQQKLGSHPKGT